MSHVSDLSIGRFIVTVRGKRVLLASDLARVYGVQTRALNQAVKRNAQRFPGDFVFRLTLNEAAQVKRSRSQTVILKQGTNTKYPPLAFTEHGAIMAASVLNSSRAIQMSVYVVRAFLRLREWAGEQVELSARLGDLERKVGRHDQDLGAIIQAIRRLMSPPARSKRRIGFATPTTPSRSYRRLG